MEIVPQRRPLLKEEKLDIDKQLHIFLQLSAVLLQYFRRFPQPQRLVGPLRPRLHTEMTLACHKQGVILQPTAVLRPESGDLSRVPLPTPLLRQRQHLEAALIDLAIVHIAGLAAPLAAFHFAAFQQTVADQHIQIDEVGISGESREALIGGVSVAGGAERQHLPVMLARLMEKISKIIGCLAQRADAIGRRQGGDSKQNTTGTFHSRNFSSMTG